MPAENKQEEFLGLFEPVRESLSRFARAITRDRQDAHDLVGEAVLIAYENFDKLKKKESFKSYIFTITARLHKRKIWRRRLFGNYDEGKAENLKSHMSPPDAGPDVEMLYNALGKLPEKQREAIVLFEISGFSLEEIKEMQGGTLSGVKSRLKRGREKLSELLDARDESFNHTTNGNVKKTELKGYHKANGTMADINNFKNEIILKVKK